MRVDRNGRPMSFVLTPGQTHCSTVFEQVMNAGAVKRPIGRPKLRPAMVVGDKGYSSLAIRRWLRSRHMGVVIPRQSNQRRRGPFFKNIYRKRNRIERTVGRFKQFRGLATRYTKSAHHFLSQWYIAATLLAL